MPSEGIVQVVGDHRVLCWVRPLRGLAMAAKFLMYLRSHPARPRKRLSSLEDVGSGRSVTAETAMTAGALTARE